MRVVGCNVGRQIFPRKSSVDIEYDVRERTPSPTKNIGIGTVSAGYMIDDTLFCTLSPELDLLVLRRTFDFECTSLEVKKINFAGTEAVSSRCENSAGTCIFMKFY